jgi:hypothetical protein
MLEEAIGDIVDGIQEDSLGFSFLSEGILNDASKAPKSLWACLGA